MQRIAQKYFNYANTRVVVVGKAETVKPGLEKLGYTLNMYDRYAKPVEAKASTAAVNMSADDIIKKYILVTGGEEALKKITSISVTGTMVYRA